MKYPIDEKSARMAESLLRIGLGMLMLLAGAGKFVNGYFEFITATSIGFTDSLLPIEAVRMFFAVLPVVEVVLGVILLFGIWRKRALFLTGILFLILIFGMLVRSDMNGVNLHFIYLITIAYTLSLPAGYSVFREKRKKK